MVWWRWHNLIWPKYNLYHRIKKPVFLDIGIARLKLEEYLASNVDLLQVEGLPNCDYGCDTNNHFFCFSPKSNKESKVTTYKCLTIKARKLLKCIIEFHICITCLFFYRYYLLHSFDSTNSPPCSKLRCMIFLYSS